MTVVIASLNVCLCHHNIAELEDLVALHFRQVVGFQRFIAIVIALIHDCIFHTDNSLLTTGCHQTLLDWVCAIQQGGSF